MSRPMSPELSGLISKVCVVSPEAAAYMTAAWNTGNERNFKGMPYVNALSCDVIDAFNWKTSPQGYSYWNNIRNKVKALV